MSELGKIVADRAPRCQRRAVVAASEAAEEPTHVTSGLIGSPRRRPREIAGARHHRALSRSPALSISQKRRRRPRFRPTSGHKSAILGASLPCNRLDFLIFVRITKGSHRAANHRPGRRRPQHPDLRPDGAGGRGLRRAHLHRRRRGAARPHRQPRRSRRPRHQDAAHGRHGAAGAAAPAERAAGDLPHLQGRRGGRAHGPAHGRRRLHQEAVLAAPADRAHPRPAAARGAQPRRQQPAAPRPWCAAS